MCPPSSISIKCMLRAFSHRYAPEFFSSAGYHRHAAAFSTVVLGVVKVVATVASLLLVDRTGRKPILLCGIAGMAISLSAVIFILSAGAVAEGPSGTWLLVAVCVFVASYAIGFGPMTWLISSELFADEYRYDYIGLIAIFLFSFISAFVSAFISYFPLYHISSIFLFPQMPHFLEVD